MRDLNLRKQRFPLLENKTNGWFLGLFSRLTFLAVLFPYYLNSAFTKPGEGLFGIFAPQAGAFAQILPPIAEAYTYDTSAIPFFPWHLIVIAGTATEFILPVLLVFGILTRLSALGMLGFIVVQTVVDVVFHNVALGGWFDRVPDQLIDTRLLWVFPLVYLIAQGAGKVSVDGLFSRNESI